ncbi:MAG TPA: hypothetical protein VK436_09900 [Methanocella sp.]|nr:hypothetical protein [Methanocella sp.]
MFDAGSIGVIAMIILLIVIVLAVLLKLLNPGDREIEVQQVNATPVPFDDSRFMDAFVEPVYEDGLEHLEDAVDSIRNGWDVFEHGAYVEAAEEFIAASRSIDEASRKFREMLSMVDDQGSPQVKLSRQRLAECKRFRQGARDMEAACDAMLAGKKDDALALVSGAKGVRRQADEWKKEL